MKRALIATLVAGAFAASASGVFAETTGTSSEAPLAASQGATEAPSVQRQAHPQRAFRLPSERVEARLAYLKTALKITSAQESQWNTFANTLRTQAKDMDKRIQDRRAQGAKGSERGNVDGIARLERMQTRMQERSQRLGQVIIAAKPLYASFSPEQKQVADEMIAKGGRGHRGGHGGHFKHHGMQRPNA